MQRGSLVPRSIFDFPSLRIPSFIDEIDDLLPVRQTETASALSVSEDDKNIYIEAAIPGIDPNDVEVTYERGMLWIRGEAQEEEKDKKKKYYRRAARSFSYRIAVPGDVDANAKPEAESKNGMIMITFPKAASATPKKITVKGGKTNGEARGKTKSE